MNCRVVAIEETGNLRRLTLSGVAKSVAVLEVTWAIRAFEFVVC